MSTGVPTNIRKEGIEKAYISRFEGVNKPPSSGRGTQAQGGQGGGGGGLFPRRPSDNSINNNKKPHMNYRSPAISPEKLEALLNKPFYPGLQFSVRQIINQIIKPLNKPTILNFPIGHGGNIITLPIGVYSEFNANKKQITILEQSVSF